MKKMIKETQQNKNNQHNRRRKLKSKSKTFDFHGVFCEKSEEKRKRGLINLIELIDLIKLIDLQMQTQVSQIFAL